MKTIYDHDRLIARFAASNADVRMFFEESNECRCTEWLKQSAP